jgi:hypothetical protein
MSDIRPSIYVFRKAPKSDEGDGFLAVGVVRTFSTFLRAIAP